jgi:hypothetical protein
MSKLVGDRLPDDLYRRLAGNNLQACAEKAILICSVDANGFAHPAVLSYFEVAAKDANNIRLATYKGSSTSNNMRRNGKLTMLIIDTRTAYYIKGSIAELEAEMRCSSQNSKFNLHVEQVLADEANEEFEPGSYILSGVTYKRQTDLPKVRVMLQELLT